MATAVFLLLSLWAVGLIECETSAHKCSETEGLHHVQVLYEFNKKTEHCAGTLIHKQWVITAKDCYKGIEGTLKVELGRGKTMSIKTIKNTEILTPYPAPIWLLKLPEPVKNIEPAGLPTRDCIAPHEGAKLQLSGYGFTKAEGGSHRSLMCLDAKISKCKDPTETEGSPHYQRICGEDTVCKEGTSCKDDYGSGLLKKETVQEKFFFRKDIKGYVLYGVLIEAQNEQLYFVDTCAGPLKKWLDEVLKKS